MAALRTVAWVSLALIAGCATQKDIADQAIKANMAVEDSGNRMLLLNVVRAVHQRPMHFSAISKIGGPIGTLSPSASFKIPFGPDASASYDFLPAFKADLPAFDVAPLDTQDFMRGITTPAPLSLIKYYLDQGWPLDFTLSLFVRKFEFFKKDKESRHENREIEPLQAGSDVSKAGDQDTWVRTDQIVNYPGNEDDFNRFQEALDGLHICGMKIESVSTASPIGPPMSATMLMHKPDVQINVAKEKLKLKQEKDHWTLMKSDSDHIVIFRNKLNEKCTRNPIWGMFLGDEKAVQQREKESKVVSQSADTRVVAYLRSTEAMLYYLGELARAQFERHYMPDIFYGERAEHRARKVPLFVLKRGEISGATAVSVEYDGERYAIPAGREGGQSMHALSLVTQLIGLQKKASDLPTSPTVRILGQ